MGRLDDKRALITVAGQGIVRANALALAEEGAQVLACDVYEAALVVCLVNDESAFTTGQAHVIDGGWSG